MNGYLGIDIGSISTKGVIIDDNRNIIASTYIWTEGNPVDASLKVIKDLENQVKEKNINILGVGTTGSARKLIGSMLGANSIKNGGTQSSAFPPFSPFVSPENFNFLQ